MGCEATGPGPAYKLGNLTGYVNHDFTKNRAPAYSLGLKSTYKSGFATPGPYKVENVDRNGKYPYAGWTIESKAATKVKPFGPGPLSYSPEKMKSYSPAYSLGLKPPLRSKVIGPSPADYFPQFPSKPGYTIGGPFKNPNKARTPGPNAAVPTDLFKNRAPAYSLGLKGRPLFNANAGPGPKYYPSNCVCHQVPYAYSFGMRHGKCSPPLITYEDNN